MREIVVIFQAGEYLIFHSLGFRRIEGAVCIGVEVGTENLTEKGIKLPAHTDASQFCLLDLKRRSAGDPHMWMGQSWPGNDGQQRSYGSDE
ncbi:MAG: hypothetical protein P8L79_06745 [Rhodospirillaceae bacterium]|nr:hypothetical protein [Rhodospirillaceae bacterium]